MKFSILLFLCLFAVSARGQITLEHTYPANSNTQQFALVEVDSALWKYITFIGSDTITLYNLDHSIDRIILIPPIPVRYTVQLSLIERRLFDVDAAYEYMLYIDDVHTGEYGLRIFKDDGTILFTCDSCKLDYGAGGGFPTALANYPLAIKSTSSGLKMIVLRGYPANQTHEVYSLPGKLPSCPATAGVVNSAGFSNSAALSSSVYPNPSSGPIRIAYELPAGVSHGEIILTSEDGREVKRYRVTNAFSDILLQNSELPSGSYFYTVVTERGASAAKRIVVVR